jgi:hypothetical protein
MAGGRNPRRQPSGQKSVESVTEGPESGAASPAIRNRHSAPSLTFAGKPTERCGPALS